MAEAAPSDNRPLDEVMLAMDVVDTLRYQQSLVERELGSEDQDRLLTDRLRKIYESQGLDVSDRVLEEGVAALKEERFVYRPPELDFRVRLAHLYVDRGVWARRCLLGLIVLVALWGAYYLAVSRPARQRLASRVEVLNSAIVDSTRSIDERLLEVRRLRGQLARVAEETPESVAAHVAAQTERGTALLEEADTFLAMAGGLSQAATWTPAAYIEEGVEAEARLRLQKERLQRAAALVDSAESILTETQALGAVASRWLVACRVFEQSVDDESRAVGKILQARGVAALQRGDAPAVESEVDRLADAVVVLKELRAARDTVLQVSRVPAASTEAQRLHDAGIASLESGDSPGAHSAVEALRNLGERLDEEYTVRVVSRPGERSGVWRIPDRNPESRNYYVIVEAVSRQGRVLSLPVTSEEDGRTSVVRRWGVRVSESTFERVKADKSDDGVIQNATFGSKRRGYLEPEYTATVQGGAITSW